MIKKLKQILQPNPSVPYIRAGKEKEFAGIHKVLKTKSPAYTSNGQNDDEVYNASKVKVAPRPGKSASPESSPKDSYGEGKIALKVSPDTSEDEYGGHDEEVVNELSRKTLHSYIRKSESIKAIDKDKDAKDREKRTGGILRATKKTWTAKEETVNEISDKLITKMYDKAGEKMYASPDQKVKRQKFRQIQKATSTLAKRHGWPNVHDVIQKARKEETELDEKDHGATHQLRIARKTLLMPDAMANVMGGMNKKEAAEIIKRSRERLRKNEPTVMTHEEVDEGHIHMTVTHESNTKPLFKAKASSDADVRTKLEALKTTLPNAGLRVGVQNTKTGETWSGKPHHKFPGFGEEAINEISDKTLKSYKSKVFGPTWDKLLRNADSASIRGEPEEIDRYKHKLKKRYQGYKRASKRLGEEEEAINELSMKVLHNYAQKSRQDAARLQTAQSAAIKTGTDPENVFTHKGFHKAANRGKGFDLAYKKFYAKAGALRKEDLFIEQIPSIPPDQPIGLKPLKKASSIEGLARRGVKLRVAQKKHELLKKRII